VKALIVEDEQLAIDALEALINGESGFIEVTGIARDGERAITMIEQLRPELIFLDINIPVVTGLELLNKISYQPHVVFTTAYDEYALKAFELNSVDYLLKPISKDRFSKTVQRLKNIADRTSHDQKVLLKTLEDILRPKDFTSMSVKVGDRVLFIPLDNITHFFAEDKYVLLNTIESKSYITPFTIQELQDKLPANFIRISRSVIINFHHIREARKLFGKKFAIIMKDSKASEVMTGGSYVENFISRLNR
jgi:two-component system, LytTR family, response regulator